LENAEAVLDGALAPPLAPADVYPDDDGGYTIDVDGPSFPSRRFAESVRLAATHHDIRRVRA
jgi:hypothetical protein